LGELALPHAFLERKLDKFVAWNSQFLKAMNSVSTSTSLPRSSTRRPGRVKELRGIIFQSDQHSIIGSWFIRPVEMLDLHLAGLGRTPGDPPLAIHVGLHVLIQDDREFVVQQLCGTPRENFVDGLNWTPLETFHARDHGGWDVTVSATTFRQIDDAIVLETIEYLNVIPERPFVDENCTMFVERAFGKRRMFADSPTGRLLGLGLRVGDPALPLLRPDARLYRKAERLLRADMIRGLPDAVTEWDAPNARLIARRLLFFLLSFAAVGGFSFYRSKVRDTGGSRQPIYTGG